MSGRDFHKDVQSRKKCSVSGPRMYAHNLLCSEGRKSEKLDLVENYDLRPCSNVQRIPPANFDQKSALAFGTLKTQK